MSGTGGARSHDGHSRSSGDAWVTAPDGARFWGRFGAAGLLVLDPNGAILLQHRVAWSHHGGTWGIPGGARHEGESAASAALREAHEEAGVPRAFVEIFDEHLLDLGFWSYTTVLARSNRSFEPVISDPESIDLQWTPIDDVTDRMLHPGFAAAWPALRAKFDDEPR